MLRRAIALALVSGSAHAALPSVHSLGAVTPTPSGIVNSKYRDGDDGTGAIPLLWGTCPSVNLTVGSACTTNLRTACTLQEPGTPDATLSLLSGTLPSGCSISGDGITGTVSAAASASVVVRATRSGYTADTAAFTVSATDAPVGDATAPTIPLGLAGTDNLDGTGTLTWDAASDPVVSGVVTGVASYRVKLGGSTYTVTAPQANIQPALAQTRVGSADGETSSQSGADWTLTFGGAGIVTTSDQVLGRWAQVTGDFVATAKITAYTPTSGTAGSIGIAARGSTDANAISIYARWRDTDDKCNIRYRLATTNNAANGAVSSAYTLPVWLRLERASDNWSLSCSSDGTTFTAVSTQSASPGQTVYVGPFITSGSAGNTATGTVAQFNVHQGSKPSYTYTGAGGSFTVSSYDGTTRSSESSAVTLTPTGSTPGGGGYTIPAATATVCASGCDFSPAQLQTIAASAANAAANGIAAGSVLELRTATAGTTETWATRFVCSGVSGTSGNPIWLTVRQGDHVKFDMATSSSTSGALVQLTDCDYWLFVGSTDETTYGLEFPPESRHSGSACIHFSKTNGSCYQNEKALGIVSSTGVGFLGVMVNGARNYVASNVDSASDRILFRFSKVGASGSNAADGAGGATAVADGVIDTSTAESTGTYSAGDSDSSEAMSICSQRTVLQDVTLHHSGHVPAQPCGPNQVWRRVIADMNWLDRSSYGTISGQAGYTGNHSMVIKPAQAYGISGWNTTLFGPLIEDSLLINSGTEPEHKEWIESAQLEAFNLIFRGNYIVQRQGTGWFGRHAVNLSFPACGVGKGGSWSDPYVFIAHNKFYNNSVWGGAYGYSSNSSGVYNVNGTSNRTSMNAAECSRLSMKNNLFQGVQTGRNGGKRDNGAALTSKDTYIMSFSPAGSFSGWSNGWKGAQVYGNIFGRHPTDPASTTWYKINLSTGSSGGTGGGTALLTDGAANGDWDCTDGGDTGTWPSNWCGNQDVALTWASGTTTPAVNASPLLATDPTTVRAGLTLASTSPYGLGDAWPMTYVATADTGTGTTLVLDDARWIYDGWDIDEYTWGGVHTERPDCIAVGATVGATAASATVVAVATATDLDYANNTVTLASGVTRVDGAPVWPATRNSDGSCGAVWDNRGAAQ